MSDVQPSCLIGGPGALLRESAFRGGRLGDAVLARRRGDPRFAAWCAAFPADGEARVAAVLELFPATDLATFQGWAEATRSTQISWEEDARELAALADPPERRTILPLRDPEMDEFRTRIMKVHWLPEGEITLDGDAAHLPKASPAQRALLENCLVFFNVADELVMEGIDARATEIAGRTKEGAHYLCAQMDQECTHSKAYGLQVREIIPRERQAAAAAAMTAHPVVARMADWVRWWIHGRHRAADVVTALALLEGALFSGFFAALQYFKTLNLFPGVTGLNEFIARDEYIHTRFWCFLLAKRFRRGPDPAAVAGITAATVALSDAFFAHALPDPAAIAGINPALLGQHVRYTADGVLRDAGLAPCYKVASPFAFMDALVLNIVAKANFFEHDVTAYQELGPGSLDFSLLADPLALPPGDLVVGTAPVSL
jgi:ribonucleoside-diphosphate reductase subunit M2